MRFLTVLLALTLSTVASAADPECVDAVRAPIDTFAQELPPEQASLLFATLDDSDIAEEACDGPPVLESLEDWVTIQAPEIVCAALATELSKQLRMMARLTIMHVECEQTPECTADDAAEILAMRDGIQRNVSTLMSFMGDIGC